MEVVYLFIFILLGVLVYALYDLSRMDKTTVKDVLKYPHLSVDGTEFEDYIDRKIESAIRINDLERLGRERNVSIELSTLANALGYTRREVGEWVKIKKRK